MLSKLTRAASLLALVGLAWAPAAFAQSDDEDDFLNDLLGEDPSSVASEQAAVRSGDLDDRAGVDNEDLLAALEGDSTKRVIKTIERKDFLKLGRFEAVPNIGFVTNDPFLNRYIVGVGLAYHATEIFAFEGNIGYSPDLGQVDWKPLTTQLVTENHVSPDISKLSLFGNGTFQFSPVYGKIAWNGRRIINFDIFGAFGMGFTRTTDDLEALGAELNDEKALATANQIHPTTNFGGGFRVIFNENLAFRLDGRSLVYIETVNSTTLEMKNNFILGAGVSFFFPGMDT